jgi:hypothetical protein
MFVSLPEHVCSHVQVAVKLIRITDVEERALECLRREVAVLLHTTGECKQVGENKAQLWMEVGCVRMVRYASVTVLWAWCLVLATADEVVGSPTSLKFYLSVQLSVALLLSCPGLKTA